MGQLQLEEIREERANAWDGCSLKKAAKIKINVWVCSSLTKRKKKTNVWGLEPRTKRRERHMKKMRKTNM